MANRRRKPETYIITDNKQADDVLFKLQGIIAELQKNDNEADAAINRIKQETTDKNEPLKTKLKEYETALASYAEINKDELCYAKKSLEMNFGLFGFRVSSRIKTKKTTLAKLIEQCIHSCIKTKQTVDKNALKELTDDQLQAVDAERVTSDQFYYEVKSENISELTPV